MKEIQVSKFKATCLSLLDQIRRTGHGVLVTKNGIPLARVLPPEMGTKAGGWLGAMADVAEIREDLRESVTSESDWSVLQ